MAGDRVRASEYAVRVNAAADLVEAGVPAAEAARVLAGRFGCSVRQARRYADQAARAGRAEVPQDTVVFTVKLPAGLAARVRARVSSKQQAKDQTIGSQTQALRVHAASNRLEVPESWVFCDEGHSGATLVRPALEALS